jgi:lipopolysaccharide/colanic/teichoic acid biosynthesis glycosyltransferase
LKRLLDRVLAAFLLLLFAPILLVLAVLLTGDMLLVPRDRGGWLYRERRVSRGREFDLLKLRTLRMDVLNEARRAGGHARAYEADAANLTWPGHHVLKRWYLDELPQLWNVLRGDMSLVGPRPWPPSMVADQEAQGLRYRRLVPAGWTGPAQVRKGVPGVRFADLDLAYVEACRTWPGLRLVGYDLGILGQTVRTLLRGEGLQN